jgi:hypothetical protein
MSSWFEVIANLSYICLISKYLRCPAIVASICLSRRCLVFAMNLFYYPVQQVPHTGNDNRDGNIV